MRPPFPDTHHPLAMNARAGVSRLVEVDADQYRAEIALKADIVQTDRAEYCQGAGKAVPLAWEAVELVLQDMARTYPDWFPLEMNGLHWTWTNALLGTRQMFTVGANDGLNPLRFLASQTQEDWMLLVADTDGALRVVGGDVRFPSGWSLRDKMGQDFFAVHAPVPGVNHAIGTASDLLLRRLKAGRPVGRWNVSFAPTDRLCQSPVTAAVWLPSRTQVTPQNAGRSVFVRSEWQVLSRLPRTQGVLFSIRTFLENVDAVAHDADTRARLLHYVQALSPEMLDYRGMTEYIAPLCEYLSRAVSDTRREQ